MAVVLIIAAILLWLSTKGQGGGASASIAPGGTTSAPGGAGADTSQYGPLSTLAAAIAQNEGYNVPGSLAQRTNNQGNIGTYGGKVNSYADPVSGWAALQNYIAGKAQANPSWDFYDFSHYYLTGDTLGQGAPNGPHSMSPDTYAENLASQVGVDPTTPVSQYLGG